MRRDRTDVPTVVDESNAQASLPPLGTGCALFLDIDGTLLEIASTPDAVRVDADLVPMLTALLSALGGAVALVSGRTMGDVDRYFPLRGLPVAALHGVQWRDGEGHLYNAPNGHAVDSLRAPIEAFAARREGLRIEDKGASIALHYRQVPELAEQAHAFIAKRLQGRDELTLLRGKMVIEVKPSHVNKGSAIERFMAGPPFQGRTPVFIGDDVTDEDGFAAVNRLGGWSIRVGSSASTQARYRLADVPAVRTWLAAIAADHADSNGEGV